MFYEYVNLLLDCETEDGLTYIYDKISDLHDDGKFTYDELVTLGNLYGKLLNLYRIKEV